MRPDPSPADKRPAVHTQLVSRALSEQEWLGRARPLLLEDNFLLSREQSHTLIHVRGTEVVLLLEGYKRQCEALGLQTIQPRWTSLQLRRRQSLFHSPSLFAATKLGAVEICRVLDISFHHTSHAQLEPWGSFGLRRGELFVTLLLGSLDAERPGHTTALDYHVGSGVADFIIERSRYSAATGSNWQPRHKVKMWWEEAPGMGSDWYGTVVEALSPRATLWEALRVRWEGVDSDDEPDCVNLWEVQPDDRRLQDQLDGTSSAESSECLSDADYYADEADDPEDRAYRHAHKRRRADSSGDSVPFTMQQRIGKMDWSSYYCAVCNDGGEIVCCDGRVCLRSFHVDCLQPHLRPQPDEPPEQRWFCQDCRDNNAQCVVCKRVGRAEEEVLNCRMGCCGLSYHPACLESAWAGHAAASSRASASLPCPSHFCASCGISGDAIRLLKCWNCSTSYHCKCVPAACDRIKLHTPEGKPKELLTCERCQHQPIWQPVSGQVPGKRPASAAAAAAAAADCAEAGPVACRHHPVARHPSLDAARRLDACRPCSSTSGASDTTSSHLQLRSSHSSDQQQQQQSHRMQGPHIQPRQPRQPEAGPPLQLRLTPPVHLPPTITWRQDGKTLRKVLTGKPIFLFGGHAKGGGCDWMLPVTNLKFHSRLMVTPASGWTGHRVTLEYFCKQAERQASVRIIAADGQSAQPLASYASQASCPPRQLTHGCVISVCDVYYRLELPTVRPGPEMALLC